MPETPNSDPMAYVIIIAAAPPDTTRMIEVATFVPPIFALKYPVNVNATMTDIKVTGIDTWPRVNIMAINGIADPTKNAAAEAPAALHGFVRWCGSIPSSIST